MGKSAEVDESGFGLIAWLIVGVVGIVAALGATGGIMYAADTEIGATVIAKNCAGGGGGGLFSAAAQSTVTIETKFPLAGIKHTLEEFDDNQCRLLEEGKSFATYAIRSGHTVLYKSEGGQCLYDSEKGIGC